MKRPKAIVEPTDDLHHYYMGRGSGDARDFPADKAWGSRTAVCRRCCLIMSDRETSTGYGGSSCTSQSRTRRGPLDA